ncbi:MAG: hypothetical protein ACYS47_07090 [Planctomycetota bacterium]
MKARLGRDKKAPFRHLAREAGTGTPLGDAALEMTGTLPHVQGKQDWPVFWPGAVDPADFASRRFDYQSPEHLKAKDLIKGDPEELANHLWENPFLLLSPHFTHELKNGMARRRGSTPWKEEEILRFLEKMASNPRMRRHATRWISPGTPRVARWCARKLEEDPTWSALAVASTARTRYVSLESLRRFRKLTTPSFPIGTVIHGRTKILTHFAWTLADPAAYLLETLERLEEVEDPVTRWRMIVTLFQAAPLAMDPDRPETLEKTRSILRAFNRLPEAGLLPYCSWSDLPFPIPGQSYGWPITTVRYLLTLVKAGRRDEALAEYADFFGIHSRPKLLAFIRSGDSDAPLDAERPLVQVECHSLEEKGAEELVGILMKEGTVSPAIREAVTLQGIQDEMEGECIRRFADAPYALSPILFEFVDDEAQARDLMSAVIGLRTRLGLNHLFTSPLLTACFKTGLLTEAAREAADISKEAPADKRAPVIHAGALAILGDGKRGITAIRRLIERLGSGGEAYETAVEALVAVHRFQSAFVFRQEALEVYRKKFSSEKTPRPKNSSDPWHWLLYQNKKLLDNAVVEPEEVVMIPETGDFRDRMKAAQSLGRFKDYARIVEENFDKAKDDEERLKWLVPLHGPRPSRVRRPKLVQWLNEYIAAGKPMSPRLARGLELDRKLKGVEPNLRYVEVWTRQGDEAMEREYLFYALKEAVSDRSREDFLRCFHKIVERFPEAECDAANYLWRWRDRPEDLDSFLLEPTMSAVEAWLRGEEVRHRDLEYLKSRVEKLPSLHPRIAKLARELLAQPDVAPVAASVCAKTGWADLPKEEILRAYDNEPAAAVLSKAESEYLDYLVNGKRWDEALRFADMLDARVTSGYGEKSHRCDVLIEAGRRKEAVLLACQRCLYEWLADHQEEAKAETKVRKFLKAHRARRDPDGGWRDEYKIRDANQLLIALLIWSGKYEKAADTFMTRVAELRHTQSIRESRREIRRFAHEAFSISKEFKRREKWKNTDLAREAALAMGKTLLNRSAGTSAWEPNLLAGRCVAPLVEPDESPQTRARGFKILSAVFNCLGATGHWRIARDLCQRINHDYRWECDEPHDLDPLFDQLDASLAAAQACKRDEPWFPFKPRYVGWERLPLKQRFSLLRKASRLLEFDPISGPAQREFIERLEREAERAEGGEMGPDEIPTPSDWLKRQWRIRRHLLDPDED